MKTLITIPTYNERGNIERLITAVFENVPNVDVLVLDDNSPDGTAEIVESMMQHNHHIHIFKRERKLGLASAYITGFKWGLDKGFDWFYEMDADFSHNPKYLKLFEDKKPGHDFLIGSRYIDQGGITDWPLRRKFMSMGGNLYAKTILGIPINDLTGGFNCWHRKVLESIGLDNITSDGYSFQIEMKYRAFKKGFKYIEIPIVFEDRTCGKSKMNKKIFLEAMYKVIFFRLSLE